MDTQPSHKIIITGGTGLLGSHLLIELAKTEDEIIALKRPSSKLETVEKLFRWHFKDNKNPFKKIKWVEADITDMGSLLDLFDKGCKIYHVAGKVSFNEKDTEQLMTINVQGTANVVNAALIKGIYKLCHVSSIAAIGRNSNKTLTHEDAVIENLAKLSPYAISKYEGEREVWRGIAEGLNAVIVNPTIILGPGNWHETSARLFRQVYKGLKFYPKGMNGYVGADDLAKIMVKLMESEISSERYIINADNISYQDLFTWIAQALHVKTPQHPAGSFLSEISWRVLKALNIFTGKPPLITKATAQTANNTYRYSHEKIKNQTGFTFKPIKQTIEETAQFLLQGLNGRI